MKLKEIYNRKFKTSTTAKGVYRIQQGEATELKETMIDLAIEALSEKYTELEIIKGAKGVLLLIPNENEGSIPMVLDIVNKPLDFDIEEWEEEYNEKLRKEEEKRQKKELEELKRNQGK